MPIIIQKGGDQQNDTANKGLNILRKKPIVNDNDSDDENDNNINDYKKNYKDKYNNNNKTIDQGRLVSGHHISELVDIKIYRVSKPNFNDTTYKTKLIGDFLYPDFINHSKFIYDPITNSVTTKQSNEYNRGQTSSSSTNDINNNNNQELSDIDKLQRNLNNLTKQQHKFTKIHRKEVLLRINDDEKEHLHSIKYGHSIYSSLISPTLEETLVWVIDYVNWNEYNLINKFLLFEEDLKSYQDDMNRYLSINNIYYDDHNKYDGNLMMIILNTMIFIYHYWPLPCTNNVSIYSYLDFAIFQILFLVQQIQITQQQQHHLLILPVLLLIISIIILMSIVIILK